MPRAATTSEQEKAGEAIHFCGLLPSTAAAAAAAYLAPISPAYCYPYSTTSHLPLGHSTRRLVVSDRFLLFLFLGL